MLFRKNCLKIIFSILIFSSVIKLYAENLDNEGVQLTRMQWFYSQRAFPLNYIPQGSLSRGMKQMESLTKTYGYSSIFSKWVCLGPFPAYLGVMVSGRVATVKYHPGDTTGNTIFIGGSDGGVWKTTDGGTTWAAKSDFLSSISSGALAIGQNPSGQYTNIYYGTGESHAGFNFCYFGDGLFKSTDNGDSWYHIIDNDLPKSPTYFSRIVIRPGHPNEILAACGTNHTNISYQSGLYRSTDYGETWLPRVVPAPSFEGRVINDVVFSPNGNNAYMVGPDETSEQIYEKGVHYRISTDGGATFSKPLDSIIQLKGRSHIAISESSPNIIYILTGFVNPCAPGSCTQYSYGTSVFKSMDTGFSFTKYYEFTGLACECYGGDAYQSYYDMFIYCNPVNPAIVYVGLINLWTSFDGGMSFSMNSPPHTDMQNFDVNPNNGYDITVVQDGGVFRSTDGGIGRQWLNLNEKLTLTQFYRFTSGTFNPDVIVGGAQDNGMQSKYVNNNIFRDVLGGGDGTAIYASKINPNIMLGGLGNYTGGGPPPILRSTDGGNEFQANFYPPDGIWDSQNDWIPPITSSVDLFTAIETFFTSRRVNTVTSPKIAFFYTRNSGDNWYEFGNGIAANESPQNIAISTSNSQIMFLSTGSYAWPFVLQKIYKSADGGVNWNEIVNGSGNKIPNRYITHLEIDPSDENIIYVSLSGFNSLTPGSPGHIFKSNDGGNSWSDFSSNLPDIPVNDLIIVYAGQKQLIAATDAGILINYYGGPDWMELGEGIPHTAVTDLEYNVFSGKVRASTFGRGIWELNLLAASSNIDYAIVLNSDAEGLKIENDLVIQNGGKLLIPFSCTIKMAEGKRIIIEDGGQIDITAPKVVFISKSGKWGGIEIKEKGSGSIRNCEFKNTGTPLIISGELNNDRAVNISNCTFNNGCLIASGRNNVKISNCTFNGGSSLTGTAISIVYCNNTSIKNNIINSPSISGISVSNSIVEISGNRINHSGKNLPYAGICFDNCISGIAEGNTISGFKQNIYLFSSTLSSGINSSVTSVDKASNLVSLEDNLNNAVTADNKLKAELNIIERYLLGMNTTGKEQNGNLTDLKPVSYDDGIRMIMSRLFGDFKPEQENILPQNFELRQNYPNPFNPVTTIKFGIPKTSNITLKIYDILGREVAVLVNETKQPGYYTVEFNASNYASGIYLYRIESAGFTDVKKMLMIK